MQSTRVHQETTPTIQQEPILCRLDRHAAHHLGTVIGMELATVRQFLSETPEAFSLNAIVDVRRRHEMFFEYLGNC